MNSILNLYEPYVVHYNYGNYYYQKKMYEEASKEYSKALSYKIPDNQVCLVKYNASLALMALSHNYADIERKEVLLQADNYLQECMNMEMSLKDNYFIPKLLMVLIITLSIVLLIMVVVGRKNGKLIPSLNREYLHHLENLLNEVKDDEIDNREAYQKMSVIIREFIAKSTKINVLNLTKDEINKLNIRDLSSLMDEYYQNEFSRNAKGNIIESINKTMEVIRTWNWK